MGQHTEKLLNLRRNATWLRPRDNWVLVERIPEGRTPAGLHIPEDGGDESKQEFITCKVLAIGPGAPTEAGVRIPIEDFGPGDTVIARKLGADQVRGMAPRHVLATAEQNQFMVEAGFILAVVEQGTGPWEKNGNTN